MLGLLRPLVKELTDQDDPLSCLAALSMLKEQLEVTNSQELQSQLAAFFLPHLEKLLQTADSIVKPLAMQARNHHEGICSFMYSAGNCSDICLQACQAACVNLGVWCHKTLAYSEVSHFR